MSSPPAGATGPTPAPWNGVPGTREWLFLGLSVAGFCAALPALSWPLYGATFAAVFAIGSLQLQRRWRLLLVLAVLALFLLLERQLPHPSVPFVMWAGRAVRAFFLLRAIDFALTKPRRELSASRGHRAFQFLLFVTFLPVVFAGPIALFNDFYRSYLPASFGDRRALPLNVARIAWGATKFYVIGPWTVVAVRTLHSWARAGGGPYDTSPRFLMWAYMMTQIIDLIVRFSGFTDMAIGISRIAGFQLEENFRFPLLARTPMDYWKSMHISAYRWLMQHVFYPSWDHRQLLLKILTTFVASAVWHLSIATHPGPQGAVQLLSAGMLYGVGVWVAASLANRSSTLRAGAISPGPRSPAGRWTLRIAQTAATFLFISFVNLIFRGGLTGRPLSDTWADLMIIAGPAGPRLADAPLVAPPRFIPSAHDHLNELIPDLALAAGDGRSTRLSKLAGSEGLVIFTTDASCPVARSYAPRIAELANVYSSRGIAFVSLDVASGISSRPVATAVSSPPVHSTALADADGALSGALGVRTSGEAFVLDARRTLVYRGAIDDQFGIDYAHAAPRRPYLAAALADLLDGRPVRESATAPPGCPLNREPISSAATAPVTFEHEVSRIIQSHCLGCHRSGGAGPFPLDSYEHVVERSDRIRAVLNEGRMPPWFAAPGSGPWANDPSLRPDEKGVLFDWLDHGMPRGELGNAPLEKRFPDGWDIGTPDLVVEFPQPQQIPAQGLLPYRYVTVDVDLPDDAWIQAIQIRPGAVSNMHHMLVFLESQDERSSMLSMSEDPASGSGKLSEARGGLTSYFALYAPGTQSVAFPPGTAKRLPRRTRLVFQVHYVTNGVATTDRTRMGLVFARQPPRYEVHTSSGYSADFEIPAMHPKYPVTGSYLFTEPGLLMSFLPHMHIRGTAFRYVMVAPDGKRSVLLDVPKYGFNWQVYYRLATPIPVARGTRIIATGWFDNSPNATNPDPTHPVRFGMQSTEEMMVGYFDWIPNRTLPASPSKP